MRHRIEEYKSLGADARLGAMDRRTFLIKAGSLGIGASAALAIWGRPPTLAEAAGKNLVSISPNQDLAGIISRGGAGKLYRLAGTLGSPAVYRLRHEIRTPDNTTIIGGPVQRNAAGHVVRHASVIMGGNGVDKAFASRARNVTISQVAITGPMPNSLARPTNGSRMLKVGISRHSNLALTASTIEHCYSNCLASNGGFAKDCNFRQSGYGFTFDKSNESALIKIHGHQWSFSVFDSWLHEAPRNMLWYDCGVDSGRVEGNLIDGAHPAHRTRNGMSRDSQFGVAFEICKGPFACVGNTIKNTGYEAVTTRGSADIDIAGNVFVNNSTRAPAGNRAVLVREDRRLTHPNVPGCTAYRTSAIRVHNNDFGGQYLRNMDHGTISQGGQSSNADLRIWGNRNMRGVR